MDRTDKKSTTATATHRSSALPGVLLVSSISLYLTTKGTIREGHQAARQPSDACSPLSLCSL